MLRTPTPSPQQGTKAGEGEEQKRKGGVRLGASEQAPSCPADAALGPGRPRGEAQAPTSQAWPAALPGDETLGNGHCGRPSPRGSSAHHGGSVCSTPALPASDTPLCTPPVSLLSGPFPSPSLRVSPASRFPPPPLSPVPAPSLLPVLPRLLSVIRLHFPSLSSCLSSPLPRSVPQLPASPGPAQPGRG